MDNQAEDWEKQRRIKAEKEKAKKEATQLKEDSTNLSFLDANDFAIKKGTLTKNPEAFLNSGEKIVNIGIILGLLGMVGEKVVLYFIQSVGVAQEEHFSADNNAAGQALGYLYDSFRFLSFLAPILAIAAGVSAIWYCCKTRKKATHVFISVVIVMVIAVLNQWLTALIANVFHSK